MHDKLDTEQMHALGHAKLRVYVSGFLISVACTLVAYIFIDAATTTTEEYSRGVLVGIILLLAIAQLFVQLYCFLHLGKEPKPRWNLVTFSFAAILILVIVVGSLWIMNNLNYNMGMSAEQMDTYMLDQ
jgi:cytochrome o ubiquinol oxidase subunit IV